jgi:hypothetical protein
MDNIMEHQQETVEETEKAWLSGFLEGDGWILMTTYKYKDGRKYITPCVGFTNTDASLIKHCLGILKKLNCGVYIEPTKGSFINSKQAYNLKITSFKGCKIALEAMMPYLISQKKAKAELTLAFINNRLGKTRNIPYQNDDIDIIIEYVTLTKSKSLAGFLNDYTPVAPLLRNNKGQFIPRSNDIVCSA